MSKDRMPDGSVATIIVSLVLSSLTSFLISCKMHGII